MRPRAILTGTCTFLVLAAALAAPLAAGDAVELEELVGKSDLIFLGQVIRVEQGELDQNLLRMEIQFRTDTAIVGVIEMLKGDPTLRKVEVGFPGFPKAGEPTFERAQTAIFLLTKSDQKYFEAKTPDRILPADRLGAVRRAVRAAAGLAAEEATPADKPERAAKLALELAEGRTENARRLAAYQLGELGMLEAVPALIQSLNDEDPNVRFTADIALRKITGHRAQVDFRAESPEARGKGIKAWEEWWSAHKDKKHDEILFAAVEASVSPQPEFQYAIEGLARSTDPAFQPLFLKTLDSAMISKDNTRAAASAFYLGRVKSREAAPKLAALLDPRLTWTADSTRYTAASALAAIAGQNFGTGSESVARAFEWWRNNADNFNKVP